MDNDKHLAARVRVTSWAAVGAAVVVAPLHALARYATDDGRSDLDSAAVRFWAEPAARAVRPLLDWSDPDTVYRAYGKVWPLAITAALGGAIVVLRSRRPARLERWGWRLALPGLGLMILGLFGFFWLGLDIAYLVAGLPGYLLAVVGCALIGLGLRRDGFRPRMVPVLLLGWLPLDIALSSVLSQGAGTVPMLVAWALAVGAVAGEPVSRRTRQGARPSGRPIG
jgi:hypothetical protein